MFFFYLIRKLNEKLKGNSQSIGFALLIMYLILHEWLYIRNKYSIFTSWYIIEYMSIKNKLWHPPAMNNSNNKMIQLYGITPLIIVIKHVIPEICDPTTIANAINDLSISTMIICTLSFNKPTQINNINAIANTYCSISYFSIHNIKKK
eukprot:19561_1